MLFATSFGELVLFWLIVLPLAFHGFCKFGKWFDKDGKAHDAAHQGVVGWFNKFFKK